MADTDNDNKISQIFREFCQNNSETLSEHEIRRVTFIVLRSKEFPKYFTFRARNDYKEDVVYRQVEKKRNCLLKKIREITASAGLVYLFIHFFFFFRHLEPALAFQLELNRLKNYDLHPVPVSNHKMHLYLATAKKLVLEDNECEDYRSDYRFFIRSIIR